MGERPQLGFRGGSRAIPWEPVRWESLAWFCPHPLLRRAKERIHFWLCSSGKRAPRDVPCQPCPPSWAGNTMTRTGSAIGFNVGFLVELSWASSPSLPSLHGFLLPALLLWIAVALGGMIGPVARASIGLESWGAGSPCPIVWMQQGLEDEVETCGAQGWVTGTASLIKVTGLGGWVVGTNLPRTEIGRVSFKIWCTDKLPKCPLPRLLGPLSPAPWRGRHISTVFTSRGW